MPRGVYQRRPQRIS